MVSCIMLYVFTRKTSTRPTLLARGSVQRVCLLLYLKYSFFWWGGYLLIKSVELQKKSVRPYYIRYNIYAIIELRVVNIEPHAIHDCHHRTARIITTTSHILGVMKNPTHELRCWFHALYRIKMRGASAD